MAVQRNAGKPKADYYVWINIVITNNSWTPCNWLKQTIYGHVCINMKINNEYAIHIDLMLKLADYTCTCIWIWISTNTINYILVSESSTNTCKGKVWQIASASTLNFTVMFQHRSLNSDTGYTYCCSVPNILTNTLLSTENEQKAMERFA